MSTGVGIVSALRRVRAHAGHFALLAALALVASLLLTAVPRVANRLSDEGLREYIAGQPGPMRDITLIQAAPDRNGGDPGQANLARQLDEWQATMSPVLRQLVGERWYAAQTAPATISGPGVPPRSPRIDLGLRAISAGPAAVTMVEGRWPGDPADPGAPIEAVLPVDVAQQLGLGTGGRLKLRIAISSLLRPLDVVIVGLYRPIDPASSVWDTLPPPLRVTPPTGDGAPFVATALTTEKAALRSQRDGWPVELTWRYRIAPQRLDTAQAPAVIDAIRQLRPPDLPRMTIVQGVDIPLQEFVRSLGAARAVLAVVAAGGLATLCGLVILAARLAVARREEEFALVRARGGSLRRLVGRGLAESLLVIPLAAAAGWAIGVAVPGRQTGTIWLAGLVAVITASALPVVTMFGVPSGVTRRGVLRARPSVRRLTLELTLLVLAVLGTFLLRRRGLPEGGTVDPLLVCVPVLLAVGVAVLALRAYGWPLRVVSRLAARARGSVAFLGLARAGRATVTGPLVAVVVAVATAAFCGVVAGGISDGRDRAAGLVVPASAMITGEGFAADTAAALAALPGVRSVAPLVSEPDQRLYPGATGVELRVDSVSVLVVDATAFARVAADSGAKVDLPAVLTDARAGAGPVPALVSPAVAADLPGHAAVTAQGRRYEFTVAAVVSSFSTINRDTGRFVVLPWQALPADTGGFAATPLVATGFLVAASRVDEAALRKAGDDGQRRYFTTGSITGQPPPRPSAVTNLSTVRAEMDESGANSLLVFGFVAGAAGGAGLGLLAIAFAVLAGARARGQVLSRLRTLGLSGGQWRGLLVVELAPLVGVAMLTGAVVGALVPLLLTPALGLSAFTSGVPLRVRFEPALVGGVFGLGVLSLGVALAVEAIVNRRLRLGQVLRLGEER